MPVKKIDISRSIIKAMSLFGGTQLFSIACSIIRTKLIAIWIGPVGVGLFGLYNSAIDMIGNLSNLGIRSSSVRDISIACIHGDRKRIAQVLNVVRRWSWLLGVIGATITLTASPLLSRMTFGDESHIWGFVILAIVLLFNALANGESAILQGTSMLKRLASVTMWGGTLGLVLSVPMFYFWKEKSVIPSIVAYSFSCLLFTWLFRNKSYDREPVELTRKQTYEMGKGFIRLGIFMTLSDFIATLISYIFMSYLNHAGSTAVVGYYQAGFTLVNRYSALLLSAIGMEYYPRLSQMCKSKMRTVLSVSQEINISLMVLIPLAVLFIILRNVIITLLYAREFTVIEQLVSWAMVAVVLRAVTWCMAYVILARGKGKIYIITESISAVCGLIFNIAGYRMWGITGFGIAFLAQYIVYLVVISVVYFRVFRLTLKSSCAKWAVWGLIATSSAFMAIESGSIASCVAVATVAAGVSGYYLFRAIF